MSAVTARSSTIAEIADLRRGARGALGAGRTLEGRRQYRLLHTQIKGMSRGLISTFRWALLGHGDFKKGTSCHCPAAEPETFAAENLRTRSGDLTLGPTSAIKAAPR